MEKEEKKGERASRQLLHVALFAAAAAAAGHRLNPEPAGAQSVSQSVTDLSDVAAAAARPKPPPPPKFT